MEEPDTLIRLQNAVEGKFQEKLRGIHPYKGLPEEERLRIARRFLDPLFADLSGRTKRSFVRHIKNLLKGPAAQERIKRMLETLSALEAAIKPRVKNAKIAASLWDILSAARTQLTEHALRQSAPAGIPEQKMTEKALRASEERYRALVEGVNEFIMVIQDGKAVYANPKMLHDASMTMEEFAQRPFFDFIYKEDLPVVMDYYRKRLEGDTTHHSYPFRIVDDKGRVRWMQASSIPIAWDQRPAVLVLMTDINLLKHTEEALKESEEKFRDIAQLTPQIIYEIDADYRLTFFNAEAKRMLGYAQEDIHQDFDIFTLFPEEERSRVRHSFEKIIKEGSSHGNEYTMVRNDGTRIPVIAYSAPVFRNGNFGGFRGVIIDISERKKTEDDLRLNEERLEAVLRLNQMVSSDTHEITDFALEEAVRLTKSTVGYLAFLDEDETTLTMYSWSVIALGECAITDKPIIYPVSKTGLWGEAIRQRRPVITNDYNAPSPLKKGYPEGHVKLTRHMNVPIFEGNRIVLLAGVGNKTNEYDESDVQQLTLLMQGMWGLISRKRADEARRESEQIYRSVIDNIQDVFYRSDKDGRLLMGSPSGAALFGYGSVEEMIGLSLDSFWVYPEDRERLIGEIRKHGRVQDFEGMIKKKDGTPFYASFTTHFYYDDAGNFLGTEGIIRDITKRKQAERALQESEALFRSQFEFGNIGIAITSVEKYWLRVNKRLCEMFGYAEEELLRKTWTEMTHPDDMDLNLAQFNMMLQGGIDAYEMDKRFFRKDGGIVYTHIAASCSRNPDRSVDFVITSIQDITERKKTEEMLKISEKRYRNIFENAVEGFFQSTPEGRFLSVNPAMAKMCGYATPEEMVEGITDLGPQFYVYPEERKAFMKRLEAYGVDEGFEHQVYRKDGSIIWISSNTRAVRDNSGKIIFYEGTNEDITKRKRAEAELTASEMFLKQTQSIARLGGWKANPHTDYLEWTDGIYEILEAPRDYRPGFEEGSKYFLPRYIPLIRDKVTNCLATGETFVIEAEVITDTGKELWTEVRGLAPILEGGRSYVAGTLQDITERKESEKKVLESEQAQRAILQASPIGICRIRDRSLEWFNEYMCRITGYGENELRGQSTRFLYTDEEEFNRVGDFLYRKGQAETKWVRKDGAIRDIFLQVSRTGSNAYILTASDVTGRKQLESQLLQAQKMEAVGTLAGGVAHDFNNILSAIMGYASLLQLKIDRDSPLSSYISQILTSSERAAQLTQSLLAFSRKQQITMKPFLLNDAIANIQKLLVRLLTEDIDLKTHLTHERLVVLGDVNQIGQVVMNLVTNARDAMPMGGVISIYTSRFAMDDKFVGIHGFGKPGKYAQIMVSDTGAGIDEHVLPKIFEPFFTTKAVGKGTGLGLSLVYGIIDQHDGYIDVKSEPGKGTSFFIYLPLIAQSLEAKGGQRSEAALKGTEKILIAEDNKEVRNLISMVLMENGYTVITAEDGLEAIRIFSEQAVDMVILDVIMPRMNGKETLDGLKKQQPSLKVLFMSGYTYDIIEEKGIHEEGVDLILKPLKPDELLKKVRELLDS